MRFDPRGTTAVVTGASSGIGREFARRLAERGADLVLVARREDRLTELASELATAHGAVCTVIALDLASPDGAASLVRQLADRGIHPATLVNNAGFGNHGEFATLDPSAIEREVQLNVATLVTLTRALLPDLQADGRGALVNVASTAAFQPLPRMAVYGATKAFVLSFTEAIAWESRASRLRVLALNPGPTSTEFFDAAGSDDAVFGRMQQPARVVETAFRALDNRRRPASVVSGRQNLLQTIGVRLSPRALVLAIVGRGGEPRR
ncbi:SDR family NAD(P)-dependent oxidoreductase [Marisediminicola senii]|uniref:SDR family NAD(P)-dependent oxidoreductase n=1 Tax=Marisediminicola senii TaxID=2711233 RepID=UPI0013EA8814|nr:SDR family oxidoreductase [Marisediminicola senii]